MATALQTIMLMKDRKIWRWSLLGGKPAMLQTTSPGRRKSEIISVSLLLAALS
jgi:hypothetical protein